jgi:methylmalonyl-CoA mutase N-terminal domain/subunit
MSKEEVKMLDKLTLSKARELEEVWHQEYLKRHGELELKTASDSGIPLKSMYTPEDIQNISFDDIGIPGVYPYTRGLYPLQYQVMPWMMQFAFGYGLSEHCRERYEFLRQRGMRGYTGRESTYFIAWDLPTKLGIDPDHPEASGRIGLCGTNTATMDDFERLFKDVPLDRTNVVLAIDECTAVMLAMFAAYAEEHGYPLEKLRGNTFNWLYHQWFWDTPSFNTKYVFPLMIEVIKFCVKYMPQWNHTIIDGYNVEEAGANAIQEIGATLAIHIALSEECIKAGLNPDEFITGFSGHLAFGRDFFEDVAKARAARRMWAKINNERFGCHNPRALRFRFQAETAGSTLTAQQPLNNITRLSLGTLAAVLAGASAIWTCGYDEAIGIPTEEAAETGVRIQQIIFHESGVPGVSDPLGGSYYLEWLTNKIEAGVENFLNEVESNGGYLKCWESGWFTSQIQRTAFQWHQALARKERIKVGVNEYITEREVKVPRFSYPIEIEETAIARINKFKAERDNLRTKTALERLKTEAGKVAAGKGELMPALIEAAKARATLQEMMNILKETFGYGFPY